MTAIDRFHPQSGLRPGKKARSLDVRTETTPFVEPVCAAGATA